MFYTHHIFFCINLRESKNRSCGGAGSEEWFRYAKRRSAPLLLQDPQAVRINSAGCLGRCDQGPCALIYPAGTWRQITSYNDVDTLLAETLQLPRPPERI